MAKCKDCGNVIVSKNNYCGNCGRELTSVDFYVPKTLDKNSGNNSTENQIATILLLIFIYPIGLLYMWISRPFTKTTRFAISAILIGMALFGLGLIIWWTTRPGYIH